jgi:hypothetical protein
MITSSHTNQNLILPLNSYSQQNKLKKNPQKIVQSKTNHLLKTQKEPTPTSTESSNKKRSTCAEKTHKTYHCTELSEHTSYAAGQLGFRYFKHQNCRCAANKTL